MSQTETIIIDADAFGAVIVTGTPVPYNDPRTGAQRRDEASGLPYWQVSAECDAIPNVEGVPVRFPASEEQAQSIALFSTLVLEGRCTLTAYAQRSGFRVEAAASLPIRAERVRVIDLGDAPAEAAVRPMLGDLVLLRSEPIVRDGRPTGGYRATLAVAYVAHSGRDGAELFKVDLPSATSVRRGARVEAVDLVAKPRANSDSGSAALGLQAAGLREVAQQAPPAPRGRRSEPASEPEPAEQPAA